jgi:ubiquinol-cytochrome c reductase cytochrome c subunit
MARMSRRRRGAIWLLSIVALAAFALGIASLAAPGRSRAQDIQPHNAKPVREGGDPQRGRQLFVTGCSDCHGLDARGIPHRGPSLYGVGAQAADFYLRTGRMPLSDPHAEPVRQPQVNYDNGEINDLVAYIAGLAPGPPVPAPRPDLGDLALGKHLFTMSCAGCHQVVGQAGVVTPGIIPPSLQQATDIQIAEAVRIGPYVMPSFSERQISDSDLNSIVRYVASTRNLDNRGGWGIGAIGPVPEGMVTWFVGILALLIVARLFGERTA